MSSALKSSARLKSRRRNGDPWVSRNRVLNGGGGSTKTKRNCPIYRNPNFDTDETKLLIQLWGDPKVQRELITTHKKHLVISQLAAKMEEYGYYRSPEEITTRIKNMKCFYNRLKKEMELCKIDPSWRHYAEMDAIMTRPIFSVRPNEVPAPSLKYLLEQEQEKRKERRRKAEEEGSTISDSDDDITDILAVPSTATKSTVQEVTTKEASENQMETEIESEVDEHKAEGHEQRKKSSDQEITQNDPKITEAEMSIKMEIESEEFQEYKSNDETDKEKDETNNKSTKEETIKTINLSEDEELLIPKMEPIDVDEEYDNKPNQSTSSALTQNFTQLADILKQPIKNQNIQTAISTPSSSAIIKFALSTQSSTATSSSCNTTIPTQSKISIVSPTILMPPQMATKTADLQQRQVRLPNNLHALLAGPGSRTTVTNANGMKFLLVNAADQRGPPITTSNVATAIPLTGNNRTNSGATNPSNLAIIQNATATQIQHITQQSHQKQQQQQQQQQHQLQNSQQQQQNHQQSNSSLKSKETLKRSDYRQEYKEQLKKRDLLGIKTTLLKMLKTQEDANQIQSERLAIEREHLQFERTLAEKFFTLFEQNQKMQQQLLQLQHQQQQHIQFQQRSSTSSSATQVFTTTNNQTAVASSGQIMLPPKLLITTMVPTSAAAQVANAAANSKILTTNGFTNLNSTPNNNELQLIVPKEEPQN